MYCYSVQRTPVVSTQQCLENPCFIITRHQYSTTQRTAPGSVHKSSKNSCCIMSVVFRDQLGYEYSITVFKEQLRYQYSIVVFREQLRYQYIIVVFEEQLRYQSSVWCSKNSCNINTTVSRERLPY